MTRIAGLKLTLLGAAFGLFAFVGLARADTLEVRIATGTDDAEELISDSSIDLTSSDLELGAEGGGVDLQEVGMRFLGIDIAPGSTINSATIQFTTDETDAEDTSVQIFGELSPNATTFTSAAGDISTRPKTTSVVDWDNIPPWQTEGEAGPDQLTPDFSVVAQEIIDQGGWAAGNAMVFIITPNPGGERTAESYNGDAGAAALLNIDFTPVPEPSMIALAGLGLVGLLGFGWRRRR